MRNVTTLFVCLCTFFVFYSCDANDDLRALQVDGGIIYDTSIQNQSDCTFVQIDEDMDGLIDDVEIALMKECIENAFLTKADIETNLIGKWELIGHGEGWFPIYSQPCASMVIEENSLNLKFVNSFIDTTFIVEWGLEEVDWVGQNYWTLVTTPNINPWLYINTFSNNFIYGDATPADGNMYIYEKME